ncbi:MAG: hypothetical protein SVX43_16070 [Cyanobacteriota bacterium]|nr:hypothetical protein [Cyanobacteriota bacterium]
MVENNFQTIWHQQSWMRPLRAFWERVRANPVFASVALLGSVGLFLAVALTHSALSGSVAVGEWQSLSDVFQGAELQQWQERLARDHYAPGMAGIAERSALRVKPISAKETVFWVDFNNRDELCGVKGCLYAVYDSAGERLLSVYLQVEGEDFLEARKGVEGFPTLLVFEPVGASVSERIEFVYQGGQYFPVNRQRLEVEGGAP